MILVRFAHTAATSATAKKLCCYSCIRSSCPDSSAGEFACSGCGCRCGCCAGGSTGGFCCCCCCTAAGLGAPAACGGGAAAAGCCSCFAGSGCDAVREAGCGDACCCAGCCCDCCCCLSTLRSTCCCCSSSCRWCSNTCCHGMQTTTSLLLFLNKGGLGADASGAVPSKCQAGRANIVQAITSATHVCPQHLASCPL